MGIIFIRSTSKVAGKILASKREFSFRVNIPNKPSVTVNINPENNLIESIHAVDVSPLFIESLNKTNILPEEMESELAEITASTNYAIRRVMSAIKYFLNQRGIEDNLFSAPNLFWSIDGIVWKIIVYLHPGRVFLIISQNLNDSSEKLIQDLIDSDIQPFVALRHLHRARTETNDRYKWIDATIAAELAIKEFLIRKSPELETLLLEVPSPPLDVMYNKILTKYGGKTLDKKILASLTDGVKIRNKLIHRPMDC
jgi:hypothetical protein